MRVQLGGCHVDSIDASRRMERNNFFFNGIGSATLPSNFQVRGVASKSGVLLPSPGCCFQVRGVASKSGVLLSGRVNISELNLNTCYKLLGLPPQKLT